MLKNNRGLTLVETIIALAIVGILLSIFFGGNSYGQGTKPPSSDLAQLQQQEQLSKESNMQAGMPAIKNFREKKLMKQIFELRDQEGLVTFTYLWNEMQGKRVFLCNSIGYGLPYSTQYTNPQKVADSGPNYGYAILPQADPNGLFMPESAEGTWVMCKDPKSDKVAPIYVEPRVIVSPFPLD